MARHTSYLIALLSLCASHAFAQTIDQLPASPAPASGDRYECRQGGVSYRCTASQILSSAGPVPTTNLSGSNVLGTQTGAVARALSAWVSDVYNIKAFGTGVGTGSASVDTAAFQAAVSAALVTGGTIYFPGQAQQYLVTPGQVTITIPNNTLYAPRIRLKGDGPTSSIIQCGSATGNCIAYVGHSGANGHISYLDVQDLGIFGSANTAGSIGLNVNSAAFLHTQNLVIEGFDTGFYGTDIEISQFDSSRFRSNNKGFYCALGSVTGCNSIAFDSTSLSNNNTYGGYLSVGTALSCNNCDIQYNGSGTGGTTNWGLRLDNFGYTNGVAFTCNNGYFEGNGGQADIILNNTTINVQSVSNINSCEFMRVSNTTYVTNDILVEGTEPTWVFTRGSSFLTAGAYSPSSSTPYWKNTNTNAASAIFNSEGSDVLGTTTETPGGLDVPYTGNYYNVPYLTAYRVGNNSLLAQGLTSSIGGSALSAGACTAGNVSIPNTGGTEAILVTPNTYPGDGFYWDGYISALGVVTVKLCAVQAGTPAAGTYNVVVVQ